VNKIAFTAIHLVGMIATVIVTVTDPLCWDAAPCVVTREVNITTCYIHKQTHHPVYQPGRYPAGGTPPENANPHENLLQATISGSHTVLLKYKKKPFESDAVAGCQISQN